MINSLINLVSSYEDVMKLNAVIREVFINRYLFLWSKFLRLSVFQSNPLREWRKDCDVTFVIVIFFVQDQVLTHVSQFWTLCDHEHWRSAEHTSLSLYQTSFYHFLWTSLFIYCSCLYQINSVQVPKHVSQFWTIFYYEHWWRDIYHLSIPFYKHLFLSIVHSDMR